MLATNATQTIAVFIYKDINWGERAQIGFNVGDGFTSFIFTEALSNLTRSIDERSNVGGQGVFVYRIDSELTACFFLYPLLPSLSPSLFPCDLLSASSLSLPLSLCMNPSLTHTCMHIRMRMHARTTLMRYMPC